MFFEGDQPDGAYIVKKGRMGIYSRNKLQEIMLGEIGENGIFGEMALIDGGCRSAAVRSLVDTSLGFLPLIDYNRIIHENSELSYRLMSSICLGLLNHISRLDALYMEIKKCISEGIEQKAWA